VQAPRGRQSATTELKSSFLLFSRAGCIAISSQVQLSGVSPAIAVLSQIQCSHNVTPAGSASVRAVRCKSGELTDFEFDAEL
jgi:hypothetical protein